jgi:hypothetical protein
MLKGCLVCSSMRLWVPFIAPRQLGAVESNLGRQFLPSVAWHTGQSGAPPDTVRCGSRSLFGEADRWRLGAVGAPDTVRCTPDSPMPPSSRWLGHASRGSRSRPLARLTVGSPDSPVNYSRTPLIYSRERQVRLSQPSTPDTVRCTTGHCPVHHRIVRCTQTELALAEQGHLFSNSISPVTST